MLDATRPAAVQIASDSDLKDDGGHVASREDMWRLSFRIWSPRIIVGQAAAQGPERAHSCSVIKWAGGSALGGLAVPSDDAWTSGRKHLSEDRSLRSSSHREVAGAGIRGFAQDGHDLGRKAQSARGADARAGLYGEMLSTWRRIHQSLGGGPESGAVTVKRREIRRPFTRDIPSTPALGRHDCTERVVGGAS